ncbi:MAG: hypothetical protein ACI4F4_09955 [Lachnospiraceae bacterium]
MSNLENDMRLRGQFGIERETLRVTSDGRLAKSLHPFTEAALSKDFCENQLEIITPVCDSVEEAMNSLKHLSLKVVNDLKTRGEYLWMYSNPPYFADDNEIPIAQYEGNQMHKHNYRVNLERRYGKRIMLYSGIHFNMSFVDKTLEHTKEEKDAFYMKLLKYATRYSWVITFLTAASPVFDPSFARKKQWKNVIEGSGSYFSGYASMRNSKHGYWNQFVPVLDYTNLLNYCESIEALIRKGALFSEGELYMPVRLKPAGAYRIDSLKRDGVNHIELRMFDLNPLFPLGIAREDLLFAQYFMLYLSRLEDFEFTKKMQQQAIENQKNAAKYNTEEIEILGFSDGIKDEDGSFESINVADAIKIILSDMQNEFLDDEEVKSVIRYQMKKLEPGNRYGERIYEKLKGNYQSQMFSWIKESFFFM